MQIPSQYGYLVVGHNRTPERIFYESLGSGRSIVMIHASFVDRRIWDDQFHFLADQGFQSVRYDVRGFGKSDVPKTQYTDHEDLKLLLEHLGIKRTAIVGVSNGGRIALDFAIEYPDLVDSLVLVNSLASGYEPEGTYESSMWEEIGRKDRERDLLFSRGRIREAVDANVELRGTGMSEQARERLTEISLDNYHFMKGDVNKHRKYPEPPAFKRLGEVKAPTLILSGGRDLEAYHVVSRRLNSGISTSQLKIIENGGHIANMSSPDEFNRVLLEFLSRKVSQKAR